MSVTKGANRRVEIRDHFWGPSIIYNNLLTESEICREISNWGIVVLTDRAMLQKIVFLSNGIFRSQGRGQVYVLR